MVRHMNQMEEQQLMMKMMISGLDLNKNIL